MHQSSDPDLKSSDQDLEWRSNGLYEKVPKVVKDTFLGTSRFNLVTIFIKNKGPMAFSIYHNSISGHHFYKTQILYTRYAVLFFRTRNK